MIEKITHEGFDFIKRSLPFMVVAFSFIGLAYGYGNAMMPLPIQEKVQLMLAGEMAELYTHHQLDKK